MEAYFCLVRRTRCAAVAIVDFTATYGEQSALSRIVGGLQPPPQWFDFPSSSGECVIDLDVYTGQEHSRQQLCRDFSRGRPSSSSDTCYPSLYVLPPHPTREYGDALLISIGLPVGGSKAYWAALAGVQCVVIVDSLGRPVRECTLQGTDDSFIPTDHLQFNAGPLTQLCVDAYALGVRHFIVHCYHSMQRKLQVLTFLMTKYSYAMTSWC